MKTNIKTVLAVLMVSAALASCSKEEVGTINSPDCVYFKNAGISAFSFGFLDDETVESSIFTVQAELAGNAVDYDREFDVEVVKEANDSRTRYEIVRPSVLKAGENTAIVNIKLWQSPNLDIERDTIAVKLVGSSSLIATMEENSTRYITFYSKIDRPGWWGYDFFTQVLLGRYHEIKVKILYLVLGTTEDPRTTSWADNQLKLNNYCKQNDVRYPDTGTKVLFTFGS